MTLFKFPKSRIEQKCPFQSRLGVTAKTPQLAGCSNMLSRDNSVDINKRMLTRFIIKTYGEYVTKDQLGKYLEKLEHDMLFVDEGQGKFFGHPSDFFGLIWLINLVFIDFTVVYRAADTVSFQS